LVLVVLVLMADTLVAKVAIQHLVHTLLLKVGAVLVVITAEEMVPMVAAAEAAVLGIKAAVTLLAVLVHKVMAEELDILVLVVTALVVEAAWVLLATTEAQLPMLVERLLMAV
jgi:hypothetical protein